VTAAPHARPSVDRPMPALLHQGGLMNGPARIPHRGMHCPPRPGWRGHRPQANHHRTWRSHTDADLSALLDAEDVQAVVLNRREDARMLRALRWSRDWVVDFADRRSVILVRAGQRQLGRPIRRHATS